nr:immunoglobulin heavy chain junction region [Mus musculus]NSM08724.1 immunoglobulin heavy chain junction region [Mus musculus]NSM08786.1 immunoglobulin heavy chain junction region [Mus musculus]
CARPHYYDSSPYYAMDYW